VSEALEQQTAMGEILRVIAASPTDLPGMLAVIAESAARFCGASDAVLHRVRGNALEIAGHWGGLLLVPGAEIGTVFPLSPGLAHGRAVRTKQAVHVYGEPDEIRGEFPGAADHWQQTGVRAHLCVPLMREGDVIGTIGIRRMEPVPFTDKQIALLETFADQAVIAIENARLFEELEQRTAELGRAVEQQRALGEVGQAVSPSLDPERVLATIVTNAVRLSGAGGGVIYEYDDAAGALQVRATTTLDPDVEAALRGDPPRIGVGQAGRAAAVRDPVQR